MATIKKMARVVILKQLGHDYTALPIFDAVGALSDADLTSEYDAIVSARVAEVASKRAQLAAEVAEKTATLNAQEAELV